MTPSTDRTASAGVDGFDGAYRRLVDARNEYDLLKSAGAPAGAVVRARGSLHRARAEMVMYRRMVI